MDADIREILVLEQTLADKLAKKQAAAEKKIAAARTQEQDIHTQALNDARAQAALYAKEVASQTRAHEQRIQEAHDNTMKKLRTLQADTILAEITK